MCEKQQLEIIKKFIHKLYKNLNKISKKFKPLSYKITINDFKY